jgi:hypothetical protein
MFATHQPQISAFVNPGAEGWEDRAAGVIFAAVSTIKNPTFVVLPTLMRIQRDGRSANTFNFAVRRICWDGIMAGAHVAPLGRALAAAHIGAWDVCQMRLAEIPGLGLPKSGFVMQMIWGQGGCIDSENEKIFSAEQGREIKAGTINKDASEAARLATIREYQALVLTCSGASSAAMWDRWCAYIAHKAPSTRAGVTADDVSALHVAWVREAHRALWAPGAGNAVLGRVLLGAAWDNPALELDKAAADKAKKAARMAAKAAAAHAAA